jgi:aminoglycoside N3'-acetyltransferase
MPASVPRSVRQLCSQVLPQLAERAEGGRILGDVEAVVQTDRWNSFDRFHQTSQTLARRYEEAGAGVEVHPLQTGGRIGTGRWVIQEAQDVLGATLEVIAPVHQRLLDYQHDPWHVIQWTSGTPEGGLEGELAIIDSKEEIEAKGRDALLGKLVLTSLEPRTLMKLLADKGAVGVITDRPIDRLPDALAWTKFGWGAVPMEWATARLVGLVLSQNQGRELRRLAQQRGPLRLRVEVEVRQYVGSHDVVSGIVRGADDPQDEVWVLAHSAEPGAVDNASGVALCLEMARLLEGLIAEGRLRRPRRSIRLLNAYECYGFFGYLEKARRLQPPLAGVCMDTLGSKPEVCDGRLEWHATIPMSAGFVDRVGEAVLRAGLRLKNPGYRLYLTPFVSTSDTLIGDPQYGFPCPWITTHHRRSGRGFDAYHSSADTIGLLSGEGLELCAASMAAYLYYLADAGSPEVMELAKSETGRTLELMRARPSSEQAYFLRETHAENLRRLRRWLWGGERAGLMAQLSACEQEVNQLAARRIRPFKHAAGTRRVPRRTALLSPTLENTPTPIAQRISKAGLPAWALFWADGKRDLAQIAALIGCEETASVGRANKKLAPEPAQVARFFEAHAELGYAELAGPGQWVSRSRLVADLKKLGVRRGMDLMVHSSLSAIGFVVGGAEAVVEALLEAIGPGGTLMMPSFNHRGAQVFNPLATPTTNGAIPDAFWRRADAVRSLHPTHALAACGPRAEEFCAGHLETGIWEQGSPIGRLIHGGGYILALGATHYTSTAYHVAENSVPCGCIDPFGNLDKVVRPDGRVEEVKGLAWRSAECPVSPRKLDAALDRRGLQRRGRVGNADCELVRALDLWRVRRGHLKNACPTCTIKPGYRS